MTIGHRPMGVGKTFSFTFFDSLSLRFRPDMILACNDDDTETPAIAIRKTDEQQGQTMNQPQTNNNQVQTPPEPPKFYHAGRWS